MTTCSDNQPTAATIGTFDGLHRGHMKVIDCLKSEASARGLRPLAITFDRHPLMTVAPERAPLMLMDIDERDARLRDCGLAVQRVVFDSPIARLTAREWLTRLRDTMDVRLIIVGYDNTFGCDGIHMSVAGYRLIGDSLGIDVVEAPLERGISSSAARRLLAAGDIPGAAHLLGRPFEISGTVIRGDRIGRTIGFPTANINPGPRRQLPAEGVYAATAILPDGSEYPAVVNIGRRPTVIDNGHLRLEAHLHGFAGDLYGSRLRLRFISRLRPERRFASLDELKSQIAADLSNSLKVSDVTIEAPVISES